MRLRPSRSWRSRDNFARRVLLSARARRVVFKPSQPLLISFAGFSEHAQGYARTFRPEALRRGAFGIDAEMVFTGSDL
jgi:hypothetical protein